MMLYNSETINAAAFNMCIFISGFQWLKIKGRHEICEKCSQGKQKIYSLTPFVLFFFQDLLDYRLKFHHMAPPPLKLHPFSTKAQGRSVHSSGHWLQDGRTDCPNEAHYFLICFVYTYIHINRNRALIAQSCLPF